MQFGQVKDVVEKVEQSFKVVDSMTLEEGKHITYGKGYVVTDDPFQNQQLKQQMLLSMYNTLVNKEKIEKYDTIFWREKPKIRITKEAGVTKVALICRVAYKEREVIDGTDTSVS